MRTRARLTLPRAIVFDFDGVILESADIKTRAFTQLFSHYPEHLGTIIAYHRAHEGVSRFVKFKWIHEQLLDRTLDDAESRRLGEAFSALVFDAVCTCPLVPGATELLNALRHHCHCFVASGTPDAELRDILHRRGLEWYFEGVYGAPTEKTAAIEHVMELRRLPPEDILFVGDAMSDYRAARQKDVRFVARAHDAGSVQWHELGIPACRNMHQLAGWLGLNRGRVRVGSAAKQS